jgi:hypothetical protein
MMASLRVALFWGAVIACIVAQAAIVRSTLAALGTPTSPDGLAPDASLASASDARRRPLPAQRRGLELLWVALPALALVWLFAAGHRLVMGAAA